MKRISVFLLVGFFLGLVGEAMAQVTVIEKFDSSGRVVERQTYYGGTHGGAPATPSTRGRSSGSEFVLDASGRIVPGGVQRFSNVSTDGHEHEHGQRRGSGWGRRLLDTFTGAVVGGFGFGVGNNLAGRVLPPRQSLNPYGVITGHSPGDGHGH